MIEPTRISLCDGCPKGFSKQNVDLLVLGDYVILALEKTNKSLPAAGIEHGAISLLTKFNMEIGTIMRRNGEVTSNMPKTLGEYDAVKMTGFN